MRTIPASGSGNTPPAPLGCEVCGAPGIQLSSGLVVCQDCFWGQKLTCHFLNRRFGGLVRGNHQGLRRVS